MPPRLLGPATTPQRRKAPNRREDWKQLLRKAIQRAETTQDSRLVGLKAALVGDQAESHLRRHGIIHEADLAREFPDTTP
jgi:hypothetical protein